MIRRVTNWLSFWNAETRQRLKEELQGEVVGSIYVPFGKGQVRSGDVVYCVAVEDGELRLLTRVVAESLADDPEHAESVRVEDDGKVPVTDFDRVVRGEALTAIRFAYADGSEHGMLAESETDAFVDGHRFQGRASLRELVAGTAKLDAILDSSGANHGTRAVHSVRELADDYESALDLLEDFCERFYWIKDHPDYQAEVRAFLTARGREPRSVG
jgi:hypothetical protein